MIDDLQSYELVHFLPFTREVYERLFTLHNEALWPLHLVAVLLAGIAIWRAWRTDGRAVGVILAVASGFVGWTFFLGPYAEVLWAAPWIGGAFLVQAVALFALSRVNRLQLDRNRGAVALATGTLVVSPLLAPLSGRDWTGVELFGIAPDPTVALMLALLVATKRAHPALWFIPLMWAFVSGATAWAMQMTAGLVMPTLCIALAVVATVRRFRWSRPPPP